MSLSRVRIDTGGIVLLDNCRGGILLSDQAFGSIGARNVEMGISAEPDCGDVVRADGAAYIQSRSVRMICGSN